MSTYVPTEAALVSFRRAYPQVYESNCRLKIEPEKLVISLGDFAAAVHKIVRQRYTS